MPSYLKKQLTVLGLLVTMGAGYLVWENHFALSEPRSAFLYRFPTQPSVPAQVDLKDLEARAARREPSAFDLAALASQYFQLGRLLGEVSWFDKAESTAKRSLALLPAPNPARLTLAKLADSRHQFADAIRIANEAFRDKPSTEALSVMVTSCLALGEVGLAEMYAEQAVQMRPTLPNLLLRALTLLQQGRDEEALYDFRRAVVLEDLDTPFESSRLRALWARHLLSRGDFETAEALVKEAIRVWPQNGLAVGVYGELELARGNYQAAQDRFITAFTMNKETHYLMNYGKAKAMAGDQKTALEYFDQAEKLLRKEVTQSLFGHRLQLAEVLLMRGKKEDIEEAIRFATAETKSRPSSATFYMLAQAFHAAGKTNEALTAIREALKSGVKRADYYFVASEIETAYGNYPRALFYRQLVAKTNRYFSPVGTSQSSW